MSNYTATFTTRDGFKVLEVFEQIGADIASAHLLPQSVTITFDAGNDDHAHSIARHAMRKVHTVDTFEIGA